MIDHAWGYEPVTIRDVKSYKPINNSLSSGQVLHEPYDYKKTKLIVREMIENITLDMVDKHYVTGLVVLTIGYDISNLNYFSGETKKDYYGRSTPKPAHGTIKLDHKTASTKTIMKAVMELFDQIINPKLLTRRINITVCNLVNEDSVVNEKVIKQFDLFSNSVVEEEKKKKELEEEKTEKRIQKTILDIKNKYGKNAILKGMDLEEGATTRERNEQVGGHKG